MANTYYKNHLISLTEDLRGSDIRKKMLANDEFLERFKATKDEVTELFKGNVCNILRDLETKHLNSLSRN